MATRPSQAQDLRRAPAAALRSLGDSCGQASAPWPPAANHPSSADPGCPRFHPTPTAPLSEADWHLMLNAVKSRLRGVPADPATAAAVVGDCLDAIECLQDLIDPARAHGR